MLTNRNFVRLTLALLLMVATTGTPPVPLQSVQASRLSSCSESDPAVQEIIAAARQFDQNIMKDAYYSTLLFLRKLTHDGSTTQAEYSVWRDKVIRAIANMDTAGLGRAMDKHLVNLATKYGSTGPSDQVRRDLMSAGMPQWWIDAASAVPRSALIREAKRITSAGYTNHMLSLVSALDVAIRNGVAASSRQPGRSNMILVSTNASLGWFGCALAIVGDISVALGVASCAAAVSGIALASCLASITAIVPATIETLEQCAS